MDEEEFLEAAGGELGAASDSNSDADDDRAHSKLLDAISQLAGKSRSRKAPRTEAASTVSEFHGSTGTDKVRLHELVGVLRSNTNLGSLKKQLNRLHKKKKVVETPLPKHEQARIQRNMAYEATTKELSKWDSIVQKNRKAEQLRFPLEQPSLRLISSNQFTKRFVPHTPLEKEVAALLQASAQVQLPKHKELTPAEERALKAMSIEEAKQRRAELQKYRALLSYKEAKARRQSKIKSKKYHRILRKEKLKRQEKTLEELKLTDPAAFAERLAQADADRMKERMSLKHRGGSKYMANQKLFSKYDQPTRQAIQEMNQKSRELTRKVAVESESEEEEEGQEEAEGQLVDADCSKVESLQQRSSNPWMSSAPIKKPSAALAVIPLTSTVEISGSVQNQGAGNTGQRTHSSDGASDSEQEQQLQEAADIDEIFEAMKKKQKKERRRKQVQKIKDRGFRSGVKTIDSSDSGDDSSSDIEQKPVQHTPEVQVFEPKLDTPLISSSLTRKQTVEDFEEEWSDSDGVPSNDDLKEQQETSVSPASAKPDPVEKDAQVDPKNFFTVESVMRSTHKPDVVNDGDDGGDVGDASSEDEQRMTIAQAFASDDVVDEFLSEKRDIAERDKPKDIDLTLPGWGDWGGIGLQPSKRKRKRFTLKAPAAPPRKDRNLDGVIISETKDTAIAKHQVSHLPFPFTSVQQFESSVRAPIGRTWNPETAYRKLITPRITTKLGTVIDPMDKDTTFKKQLQKTHNKRRHSDANADGTDTKTKRRKGGGGKNDRGKSKSKK